MRPVDILFPKARSAKRYGECPLCGEKVSEEDFTSKIDKQEFNISGLCKSCMDYAFEEAN